VRIPAEPGRPPVARKGLAIVPFTVHVRPYAQRALLDGVEVASDEQRVVFSLAPGAHRLRIEHPCCEPFEREVDAASAQRLGELKVPLVPRPASLRIGGDPATRVYVDGKLLGSAGDSQREPFRVRVPSDGPSPYEGEVGLRLEAPGGRAASATVRVRAGQQITVPAVLTQDPPR
jgi:serine/threonine-protein kinase